MNARSRTWVALGVVLVVCVVSAVLLAYLLRDLDWELISETAPLYLVLLLLLSVAGTVFYTLAIYLLVRASGYQTTFVQAYLVLTSSLSVNYVTPVKAGIPLRVYLYNHFMAIPTATGTALITLEALVGIVTPALIAVVGIVSLFPFIGLVGPLALLLIIGGGVAMILLLTPGRVSPFVRRLPFQGVVQRIARFGRQAQVSLKDLPTWVLLSTTGLVVLNFAAAAIRLYLVLDMLGYPVSPLALLYVQALAITAGNISMIPMGLGVRDASFTLLLAHLGIPREVALSAAIIQRLFSPGWPLVLGLISSSVLGVQTALPSSGEPGDSNIPEKETA